MDAQVSAAKGKVRSLVGFLFIFKGKRPTASYSIILDQDMALDFKNVFLMFGQPLVPHTWNSSVDLGRLHKAVPETCCAAAQVLRKIQVLLPPSRFSFQHSLGSSFSMAQHGSAKIFMPLATSH